MLGLSWYIACLVEELLSFVATVEFRNFGRRGNGESDRWDGDRITNVPGCL